MKTTIKKKNFPAAKMNNTKLIFFLMMLFRLMLIN